MSQARLTFAPRRMPANGPLRQCRSGHGARSSFKDSCRSCSRSMCGRYRSWNLDRAWLPCSLHLGCDPLRRVRDARFLAGNPSFGAPTPRAAHRRTRQLLADFKDDAWTIGLGEFDAIVTHQAVHELRHKKHAATLHRSARTLLSRAASISSATTTSGDGMSDASLYMNIDEQSAALEAAGFVCVERVLEMKGLVLHRARLYG